MSEFKVKDQTSTTGINSGSRYSSSRPSRSSVDGNSGTRLGRSIREKVRPTTERISKTYNVVSPVYDFIYGKIFEAGRRVSMNLLDAQPGDAVLDAGVGTGLNLPLFPDHCDVVGVDLTERMLLRGRERAAENALSHITFAQMDMQQLGFLDNSFDAVLSLHALSVVPDPVQTLREFRRVCKPGGKIVITNHFKSTHPVIRRIEELIAAGATFLGFETDRDWAPLLSAAGLEAERIEKVNLFNLSRAILCRNPA